MERMMKDDNLDKLIRKSIAGKKGRKWFVSSCPKEEALADYLQGRLPQKKKDQVEKHLADCETCLNQAVLYSRLRREPVEQRAELPRYLMERAIKLFPVRGEHKGKKFWVEILEQGKEVVEVMYPQPLAPVPVRGKKEKVCTNFVLFDRKFEKVMVKIRVEKVAEGLSQMRVRITDPKTFLPLGRLRVTLEGEEGGITSYFTEKGDVLFEHLSFSRYDLKVQDGPTLLAELHLRIKEEPDA